MRLWTSRGYLPHDNWPGTTQFVTIRLSDSLPADCVRRLLKSDPDETRAERFRRMAELEAELDSGRGECHLRDPRVASCVERNLLRFDGDRYRMFAWVVMPNHMRAVLALAGRCNLANVIHSWKWHSAAAANKILGRTGRFWQPEYFDRRIRDEEHLERCIGYVENNPVKAGLCKSPLDWVFGSAWRRLRDVE